MGGRIDYLGIDVRRQRLLVAKLANNSLAMVDLAVGKLLRRSRRFGIVEISLARELLCQSAVNLRPLRRIRG